MSFAPPTDLAPVVDDMSVYILPGRVKPEREVGRGYTSISRLWDDAADAERLGFRGVFLSERHSLKDAGAVLGGVAARTTRLEVGTGATSARARREIVLAGFGATMQALNGPRLNIGLGRGDALWQGGGLMGFDGFVDYARILRRLWAGETITYDGPAGSCTNLRMDDQLADVPPPKLWYFVIGGGPLAAKAAADPVWDGVVLYPFLTHEAVERAIGRIHRECEIQGRDPSTLEISHCITTAPDLDDVETRAICHARLVTYLAWPKFGEAIAKANGWGTDVINKLRNHPQLQSLGAAKPADQAFHRIELLDVAKLIPESYIDETCGVGTAEHCAKQIASFRGLGAQHTILYGSTPSQNAELINVWRDLR